MQAFKGFAALVSGVENFPDSGGLYTKPKIDRKTIMDAEFVVIPSMEMEECMDEEGGYIPEQLAGKGYVEWLEAPMVRAVVSNKLQHSPLASTAEIVDAMFYYLEYDTFKDA
ncbi:DUF7716 domain-containing protein [Pseudoduganella sp. R-43]|uniref:DUF7716 domain-containing protein n=1 Tax=unclassified Pseudoduganella TaxID=2637179 RepID=UPI003CE7629D